MDLSAGDVELHGLARINVVLGKNGSGKSFMLKRVSQAAKTPSISEIRYISPERGGLLQYDPNVDINIRQDAGYLQQSRRRNQAEQFRQQSVTLYRRLETLVLREIDADRSKPSFSIVVAKLNSLLDRVELTPDETGVQSFKLMVRGTADLARPEDISSGEAELISLGIEILSFVREVSGKSEPEAVLLLDEPDVHLHPDLQDRLAGFIIAALKDKPITLIVATHSTALLAALAADETTRLAFKRQGVTDLTFKPVTETDRAILPIFGAHPLSNVFNQSPVLIVEGEDDERIWQQVVRTSKGRVRLFPCVATSVDKISEFEQEVNNIIDAVYDRARAFSLRDRDRDPETIENLGHIVRTRLRCRAAENLMLSDDVLAANCLNWLELQAAIRAWTEHNAAHQYRPEVQKFVDGGFDRKGADLKEIRNILVSLMSKRPWEVLVDQAIARLAMNGGTPGEGSLRDFLGEKICTHLLGITP